jgi:hypothetical protein
MDFRVVAETCAAILVSLGGGGAIVFSLSGYLGKIWVERGLAKQKQEYAQLNIEFTQQLDVATRRIQTELDALSHLHKLRTQSEFEKLQELWKRIEALRSALGIFASEIRGIDEAKIRSYNRNRSDEFLGRYVALNGMLSQETLLIPEEIAKAVRGLLSECFEEVMIATDDPELTGYPISSPSRETLFEQRWKRRLSFDRKANDLELLMRRFLRGGGQAGPETPEIPITKE